MQKKYFFLLLFTLLFQMQVQGAKESKAATRLLERIAGKECADYLITEVDPSVARNQKETFVIAQRDGQPLIQGSSLTALTTGINWYLNHYAGVNLTWNRMKAQLKKEQLPLPAQNTVKEVSVPLRYYLNYCTFSYSMAFWTWERWQQEIDWMALHGINMPLVGVGTDVVWQRLLKELGYSENEINDFIAGPGFQAWWMMNNLQAWGGPNPKWWYQRQEKLARNIIRRMEELGMTPVLPGYSGMVPRDIAQKTGWNVSDPGIWCGFKRPAFLLPTDEHFEQMATLYYKHLKAVMGTSRYYSMDPFHEGGSVAGVNLPKAYTAIHQAMKKTNPEAVWVIQSWNENPRKECLVTIPKGELIVLDLFADGVPKWKGGYEGQDMIYCMLHNFGGRIGLHGRLDRTVQGFYDALKQYPRSMKGIGATPEGIETNPMLYDILFELPWISQEDAALSLENYVGARYGLTPYQRKGNSGKEACFSSLMEAWELLRGSVYDCRTAQQGTTEPVFCARPSLQVRSVSTWSTAQISHDPKAVRQAASLLLSQAPQMKQHPNYQYDLTDVMRQALVDSANLLLPEIKTAYEQKNMDDFRKKYQRFLDLLLDQDRLLGTQTGFMLGHWTEMARRVADEGKKTTEDDRDWMEWNARTLITVWGTEEAANAGGLHDYSNREWNGLLKDFHYKRWKLFFDKLEKGEKPLSAQEWFRLEEEWTRDFQLSYPEKPAENSVEVAEYLYGKYFKG